jgi:hypothetical protein
MEDVCGDQPRVVVPVTVDFPTRPGELQAALLAEHTDRVVRGAEFGVIAGVHDADLNAASIFIAPSRYTAT